MSWDRLTLSLDLENYRMNVPFKVLVAMLARMVTSMNRVHKHNARVYHTIEKLTSLNLGRTAFHFSKELDKFVAFITSSMKKTTKIIIVTR